PRLAVGTRAVVYASVGAELTQYDADVENATLLKRGSSTLPGYVQEAWPHPSKPILYVAWSTIGPSYGASRGNHGQAPPSHGISAFAIDRTTGTLHPHGRPASLRSRPIYVTCDTTGAHLLTAYNDPSGISVHALTPEGMIATEIVQPGGLDT